MKMPVLKQLPKCRRILVFYPNSPTNMFDDPTHKYMEECCNNFEKEKNSL